MHSLIFFFIIIFLLINSEEFFVSGGKIYSFFPESTLDKTNIIKIMTIKSVHSNSPAHPKKI